MIRITLAISALLILALTLPANGQIAIQADLIYPVSSHAIKNGLVLIENGVIKAIGSQQSMSIPEDWKVYKAKVLTPGLIDAHSVVGLSGRNNQPQDQDQHEGGKAVQAELRALDAYNFRDPLVEWLREHGVTTVHTGHSPQSVVSGISMVVKTLDEPIEKSILKPAAMLLATLGNGATSSAPGSPQSASKVVAILRTELLKAKEYAEKRSNEDKSKWPARDLSLDSLAEVLAKKRPLMITAERERDIQTALRLAKEFNFDLVLDGGSDSFQMLNELKQAKVPVIIHPTMARSSGERENLSMETASKLEKAGILFAFQSGYEAYVPKTRVVLFEAAIAAANELGQAAALKALTLDAARLLGVDKKIGSLEVGKDADLVLFDGDPFEYTTHVTGVIINGKVVSQNKR